MIEALRIPGKLCTDTLSEALVKIGKFTIGYLIDTLNTNSKDSFYFREQVVRVLGMVGEALGKDGDIVSIKPAIEPLLNILKDNDEMKLVRWSASIVLGKIGKALFEEGDYNFASVIIDTLVNLLYDTEIQLGIGFGLAIIGEPAIHPLISVLSDGNTIIRQGVEQALVRIGDSKVKGYLQERIETEKDPLIRQYLEDTLQRLEERIKIRERIKKPKEEGGFGITVDHKFGLVELKMILAVLENFPGELIEGLISIKYDLELLSFGGKYEDDEKEVILKFPSFTLLFHEISHFIDDKYYSQEAFKELYARSSKELDEGKYKDFAWNYGEKDNTEDFSTTVEMYMMDTKEEFLKVMDGKKSLVYLEKLLFVLDVFTGNWDTEKKRFTGTTTRMYKVTDDGKILPRDDIEVTRDQTDKIIKIGDVDIYKPDGSYNLKGLEDFFRNLVF